jgi:hypothetical protein
LIDLNNEKLMRLVDVPKALPRRRTGKRLHISAVYRWAQRGIRGVKLETIKIGGTTYTSREALQRFAEASSSNTQAGTREQQTPKQRVREQDKASRRVDDLLGRNRQ